MTETPAPPELAALHDRYAVYRCYSDHGQLLYIGSTGGTNRRFMDHSQKVWFLEVRGITFEWYADELDARNAERRAIHVEHPKHNVAHRNSRTLKAPSGRPVRRFDDPDAKAAYTAYRKSVNQGRPLSDRALGAMFGRGRTWGANRITEVDGGPKLANAKEA